MSVKKKTAGKHAKHVNPVPKDYSTVTPVLSLRDASGAIEFYKKAFGAKELARLSDPGGKILHAEIKIGDSKIMIAEEFPEWGNVSPKTIGGTPVRLHVYVKDADEFAKNAVEAGSKMAAPVEDQFYGDRAGRLEDPYGYIWIVASRKENVSLKEVQKRANAMFGQKPTE